jgi:hypothetical protein
MQADIAAAADAALAAQDLHHADGGPLSDKTGAATQPGLWHTAMAESLMESMPGISEAEALELVAALSELYPVSCDCHLHLCNAYCCMMLTQPLLQDGSDSDSGSDNESDDLLGLLPEDPAAEGVQARVPRTAAEWEAAKFDPVLPGAKVSVLQQAYFLLQEKCEGSQRDGHFDRNCK